MARLVSISARWSASAASASLAAAVFGSSRVPGPSAARIRSRAQKRFTAVGRLAAKFLNAISIAASNSAGAQRAWRWASSAIPKAAAQPIAGAPRTTIARMASATSAALVQLTYSRRAGRARWSMSSSRVPCQRRVSTGIASDDALIAAVHGYLRARRLGEKRPAHLGRELRDVAARDFRPENVVGLVRVDGHAVLLRALREHLFGPQGGIEHGVGVHGVDAYAIRAPFEGRDAGELVERRLGSGIGGSPRPGCGDVFRADHHHAPAARSELEKRVTSAHQDEIRVQIHAHRSAPLLGRELGNLARRGENSGVEHQHVDAPEGGDRATDGDHYLRLVCDIAVPAQKVRPQVERVDSLVEVEPNNSGSAGEKGADRRFADAGCGAGDERDFAREAWRLAAFLELGLLEVPVFDVENVLWRQRPEPAERFGAQDHVNGVVVDLRDDRSVFRGTTRGG